MLRSVTRPDGKTVTFKYDALGRRIEKVFDGRVYRYLWDGDIILHKRDYAEYDRPKTVVTEAGEVTLDRPEPVENLNTWVYDSDSYVPTAKIVGDTHYSIISDYIGRPVQAYDDNGNIVWQADYDIYGNLRNLHGCGQFIPFRHLGQYEDEETGLYYNRFRYYDPRIGNYISQDPIGLAGKNPTLYGYVEDCNTQIDPLGVDTFGVNQDVYALYNEVDIVNDIPKEGAKPYYIGISQNSDIRLRQYTSNGRFNPKTDVKIDLHKDIDYAKARAYEQYYIEKYKTIDKTNPKANQQNSFRHNRTDARGKGFEAEYKKIKYQ